MVTTRMNSAREVASDRQGHADNAAFKREMRGLADLVVDDVGQMRSMMVALAMPAPSHIVCRP